MFLHISSHYNPSAVPYDSSKNDGANGDGISRAFKDDDARPCEIVAWKSDTLLSSAHEALDCLAIQCPKMMAFGPGTRTFTDELSDFGILGGFPLRLRKLVRFGDFLTLPFGKVSDSKTTAEQDENPEKEYRNEDQVYLTDTISIPMPYEEKSKQQLNNERILTNPTN